MMNKNIEKNNIFVIIKETKSQIQHEARIRIPHDE